MTEVTLCSPSCTQQEQRETETSSTTGNEIASTSFVDEIKDERREGQDDDDDSDFETLDYCDLERRRDYHMRRLITAEYHFNRLRHLLRSARAKELEIKRELALDHNGAEFLNKKDELDKEHKRRKEFMLATYQLGMDQMERKRYARKLREFTDQRDDTRTQLRRQLKEAIREKIRQLEKSHVQQEVSAHYVHQFQTDYPSGQFVERQTVHESKLWTELNFRKPIIVSGLDSPDIAADLRYIDMTNSVAVIKKAHQITNNDMCWKISGIKREPDEESSLKLQGSQAKSVMGS